MIKVVAPWESLMTVLIGFAWVAVAVQSQASEVIDPFGLSKSCEYFQARNCTSPDQIIGLAVMACELKFKEHGCEDYFKENSPEDSALKLRCDAVELCSDVVSGSRIGFVAGVVSGFTDQIWPLVEIAMKNSEDRKALFREFESKEVGSDGRPKALAKRRELTKEIPHLRGLTDNQLLTMPSEDFFRYIQAYKDSLDRTTMLERAMKGPAKPVEDEGESNGSETAVKNREAIWRFLVSLPSITEVAKSVLREAGIRLNCYSRKAEARFVGYAIGSMINPAIAIRLAKGSLGGRTAVRVSGRKWQLELAHQRLENHLGVSSVASRTLKGKPAETLETVQRVYLALTPEEGEILKNMNFSKVRECR